jgi:hypothetical protein
LPLGVRERRDEIRFPANESRGIRIRERTRRGRGAARGRTGPRSRLCDRPRAFERATSREIRDVMMSDTRPGASALIGLLTFEV